MEMREDGKGKGKEDRQGAERGGVFWCFYCFLLILAAALTFFKERERERGGGDGRNENLANGVRTDAEVDVLHVDGERNNDETGDEVDNG